VENSAEVKKNKGDGEGTKSNGKAKAKEKTNDITNVSVHGNAKKVRSGIDIPDIPDVSVYQNIYLYLFRSIWSTSIG
jgi:hypothetical protein